MANVFPLNVQPGPFARVACSSAHTRGNCIRLKHFPSVITHLHLKALGRPRHVITARALTLGIVFDRVPRTKVDGETKKLDRQTSYYLLTYLAK